MEILKMGWAMASGDEVATCSFKLLIRALGKAILSLVRFGVGLQDLNHCVNVLLVVISPGTFWVVIPGGIVGSAAANWVAVSATIVVCRGSVAATRDWVVAIAVMGCVVAATRATVEGWSSRRW